MLYRKDRRNISKIRSTMDHGYFNYVLQHQALNGHKFDRYCVCQLKIFPWNSIKLTDKQRFIFIFILFESSFFSFRSCHISLRVLFRWSQSKNRFCFIHRTKSNCFESRDSSTIWQYQKYCGDIFVKKKSVYIKYIASQMFLVRNMLSKQMKTP